MSDATTPASLRAAVFNIAEVPWKELPGHRFGALSKLLVHADTHGTRYLDHRISSYQPMGCVEPHTHRIQEQIYHVLEGQGLVEIDGKRQVIGPHDVVYIPPGIEHALYNTGLGPLTFLVITAPVHDSPVPG